MLLNDKEIRSALIPKLRSHAVKPKAIIEELRVHNGNAIADVVALYNEAHCYEIKGSNDKIERVLRQGAFYNSSFRKITLVTTENHVSKALDIVPSYWGIIIASNHNDNVILTYLRGAQDNPDFSKELALLTLWKSEMLNLIEEQKHKRKTRESLAELISKTQKKTELSNSICDQLISRYSLA
jgi:hypothetical protein